MARQFFKYVLLRFKVITFFTLTLKKNESSMTCLSHYHFSAKMVDTRIGTLHLS